MSPRRPSAAERSAAGRRLWEALLVLPAEPGGRGDASTGAVEALPDTQSKAANDRQSTTAGPAVRR